MGWQGLNSLASAHPDPRIAKVQRDGHCHEAVMWYVHHLTAEMKEILRSSGVKLPMLAPMHHGQGICSELDDESAIKICDSYQEKVTCASSIPMSFLQMQKDQLRPVSQDHFFLALVDVIRDL